MLFRSTEGVTERGEEDKETEDKEMEDLGGISLSTLPLLLSLTCPHTSSPPTPRSSLLLLLAVVSSRRSSRLWMSRVSWRTWSKRPSRRARVGSSRSRGAWGGGPSGAHTPHPRPTERGEEDRGGRGRRRGGGGGGGG